MNDKRTHNWMRVASFYALVQNVHGSLLLYDRFRPPSSNGRGFEYSTKISPGIIALVIALVLHTSLLSGCPGFPDPSVQLSEFSEDPDFIPLSTFSSIFLAFSRSSGVLIWTHEEVFTA